MAALLLEVAGTVRHQKMSVEKAPTTPLTRPRTSVTLSPWERAWSFYIYVWQLKIIVDRPT
jgi:hypothetical protein